LIFILRVTQPIVLALLAINILLILGLYCLFCVITETETKKKNGA
jgi:MFS-type transporter involved in bile tolerance (Atg22 family)